MRGGRSPAVGATTTSVRPFHESSHESCPPLGDHRGSPTPCDRASIAALIRVSSAIPPTLRDGPAGPLYADRTPEMSQSAARSLAPVTSDHICRRSRADEDRAESHGAWTAGGDAY